MKSTRVWARFFLSIGSLLAAAGFAHAHFLWLKTIEGDGKPQAFLFFGETTDDEAYHMPEKIAAAKIWRRTADEREELATEKLESEERVGIVANLPNEEPCVLETAQQYGVYENWLLTYYAKHIHAKSNDDLGAFGPSKELALEIVPKASGEDLELTVYSGGEPLADAELTIDIDGGSQLTVKTGSDGVAKTHLSEAGLVSVLANHRDPSKQGKVGEKEYKLAANFASVTFPWTKSTKAEDAESSDAPTDHSTSDFRDLPEPVASFGAAVSDGWLYVYGGHTGTEHDHSAENLSKHFIRIELDGDGDWETLPMPAPLQGLPIVSHDGKIYRVGGLDARNKTTDEEEDLHSSEVFAVFDPASQAWTSLAPLPAGRSSHNAVVIGDRLYVVGGWKLSGSSKGEWQPDALVYEFDAPDKGWQKLPEPPFKRRAIAASQLDGKLVVLGGMNEEAKVSQDVFFFDPATGEWSEGPKLPGAGMAGFGVSAWNLDGRLYVSGFRGVVHRLNGTGSEWEEAARLTTPRFFHQLVPDGNGGLLAIGGASREGHLADIERIDLSQAPQGEQATDERGSDESKKSASQPAAPRGDSLDLPASPGNAWTGFRGMGNSVTVARNLPVAWGGREDLTWLVDLPGYGQSSPVICQGKVFLSTMQGENKETPTVMCFRLATGEKLWQREFMSSQPVKASNFTTRSSPTPVVDDTGVFAFFESGDLFAIDHTGDLLWQRSLVEEYGKFESEFGIGSSLAQTDDAIFVLVNQAAPSYLVAVDKSTGENLWKVDYPRRVAWSTPAICRRSNRDLVVVSAAGIVEAYDTATGSRLWQLNGFAENNIPSPTPAGEMIYIGSPEVASNVALGLEGANAEGAVPDEPEIVWRSSSASSNFSSPLYYEGCVYMVNRSGVAFCLDAETGEPHWKKRLPDTCWASPLGAEGRVYFFTKDGTTVVAKARSDSFESLSENELEIDPNTRIYGVAAVDGAFIVRTGNQLFCIGHPSGV